MSTPLLSARLAVFARAARAAARVIPAVPRGGVAVAGAPAARGGMRSDHCAEWAQQSRGFAAAALPTHEVLGMPSLSPTMERGNVTSWSKAEGDKVNAGDVLGQIETDKATLDFDSQEEGYLARILVPAGASDLPVGTPLAILVEEVGDIAAFADYVAEAPAAEAAPGGAPAPTPSAAPAAAPAPAAAHVDVPEDMMMGPAARMLLRETGLSHTQITATGPKGIITKGDVLAAVAAGVKPGAGAAQTQAPAAAAAAAQAPPAAAAQAAAGGPKVKFTDVPNSNVRKIIAKRLLESKTTIPHMYVSADARLDGINVLRSTLKEQGVKVSVNDFVVRACAVALTRVPEANAMWDAASAGTTASPQVDIAIAVATEGGLITPIVRDAGSKSLQQISAEVKELASKARENRLTPDEYQGGTFSISNLGMFGVTEFSAIINPPQAAIMAVGTGVKQAVMGAGGQLETVTKMTVTISADQRVWDGEVAGRFMKEFTSAMETPALLMSP